MHDIHISEEIKHKVPETRLWCIECKVAVDHSPSLLLDLMDGKCRELADQLKIGEISQLVPVKVSRNAYRLTGKDPARYRLSAEALLRRAVKGEQLYRINNVVDLLNLVSLSTGFSIGGYDASKIRGDISFGIGRQDEFYEGIGRGVLNIEGLPVFRDHDGAFGSPTSDSERTCVDWNTHIFLMVIIDFGASDLAREAVSQSVDLLEFYAGADKPEIKCIE